MGFLIFVYFFGFSHFIYVFVRFPTTRLCRGDGTSRRIGYRVRAGISVRLVIYHIPLASCVYGPNPTPGLMSKTGGEGGATGVRHEVDLGPGPEHSSSALPEGTQRAVGGTPSPWKPHKGTRVTTAVTPCILLCFWGRSFYGIYLAYL